VSALYSESEIMDTVLRMLARREYSEAEIRRKLEAKQAAETLVDKVIARVQELGYQNDERYTACYIRYGVSQGKGPAWIAAQLYRRGIEKKLIQQMLDAAEVDWPSIAAAQLRRKFKTPSADPKEMARQFRHLASRGFDPEMVYSAIAALKVDE
jgi:regulatory protein